MNSSSLNDLLHVTAADLDQWAKKYTSSFRLGELVRRLILATVEGPCHIHFPSDEQTYRPGWDGVARVEYGKHLVPTGVSAWELSTRRDAQTKANDDFRSRQDPLHVTQSETTYVELSAHVWPDKEKWCQKKLDRRVWKEVRAYDATDLATWLNQAPAVLCWLLPQIPGKIPASGLWSVEQYLKEKIAPRLERLRRLRELPNANEIAALLVAGREPWQKQVLEWDGPEPLEVRADTREEALCFVAASFLLAQDDRREERLSRTVVVDPGRWQEVLSLTTERTLFLLPVWHEVETAKLERSHKHPTLVPLNSRDVSREGDRVVTIPAGRLEPLAEVLQRLGMAPREARRVAIDSAGRWTTLTRFLSGYCPPNWSRRADTALLIPALLAGEWVSTWPGDIEVIERLSATGEQWTMLESRYHLLSLSPDSPLYCSEDVVWSWHSPKDAWDYLGSAVCPAHWKSFKQCLQNLFNNLDAQASSIEMSRSSVPGNFLWGYYSKNVQIGLVRSLSIIATSDSRELKQRAGKAGSLAEELVREFLKPAASSWAVFEHLLPFLAEAAPDAFLDAVSASLDAADGFWQVPARSPAGHRAQSSVLNALQVLAWSPAFLKRVVDLLARWLECEVPPASPSVHVDMALTNILRPWLPQTGAAETERLAALDVLLVDHSAIGWSLLTRLLPTRRGDWGTTHGSPDRLPYPFPPSEALPSNEEIVRNAGPLYERAMRAAGADPNRWADLLSQLHGFLDGFPRRAVERLETVIDAIPPTDIHRVVWPALRNALHQQVRFRGELTPEDLERLRALYDRLTPGDEVSRSAWQFDRSILMPDGDTLNVFSDRERMQTMLQESLSSILDCGTPILSFSALAVAAPFPWLIGYTASQMPERDGIGPLILGTINDATHWLELMKGYIAGVAEVEGERAAADLLNRLITSGRAGVALEILLMRKASKEILGVVQALQPELQNAFWERANLANLPKDHVDLLHFINGMLATKRQIDTLEAMSLAIQFVQPGFLPGALILSTLESLMSAHPSVLRTARARCSYQIEQVLDACDKSADVSPDAKADIRQRLGGWIFQ